jgi:hypothetical protein
MNTPAVKVRSPFATPLVLLVISLGMFVVWAIGTIAFAYEPAMALRDEMVRPGHTRPEVIQGILMRFFSGRFMVLGAIAGITLVLMQISWVWLIVALIVRSRRP